MLGFECRSYSLLVFSVELQVLATSLRLAWDHGYRQLLVESDCVQAIMCISNRIEDVLPEVRPLVSKIKELLRKSWHVQLIHVPQFANMVADNLAKNVVDE